MPRKNFKEQVLETLDDHPSRAGATIETLQDADVDQEDEDDYRSHHQLLQKIGKLKRLSGKREKQIRTEASDHISETTLTPHNDGNYSLKIHELVRGIRDPSGSVKKQLRKVQRKKVLNLPIEKPVVEKIVRTTNYEDTKTEVSKWEPIVEANRNAAHLEFPLKQPDLRLEGAREFADRFTPKTELEREVMELLEEGQPKIAIPELSIDGESSAVTLEEAKARHKELQRMRAIMSFKEAKMKRQKKIKSKAYRRLLKREKLKKEVKAFEELKEKNPEEALEQLKEMDKVRALERASLRHKNTGKWAKHKLIRAKNSKDARDALTEQVEISKKLLKKAVLPEPDSESDPFDDIEEKVEENAEEEPLPAVPLGFNPWLKPKNTTTEDASSETVTESGPKSKDVDMKLDPKKFLTLESTKLKSAKPDLEDAELDDSQSEDGDEDDQRKLISEAFAEDDVVNSFVEEKEEMVDKEENKDISLYLPGWGSWAGAGIKENPKRANKFVKKAKKLNRVDSKLPHVIISEKRSNAISKYMVKDLPFPFKNVKQFENSIRHPVGHTWNPETAFRKLIQPKITTKAGKIIEPMDSEDLMTYQKSENGGEVALKDIISIS